MWSLGLFLVRGCVLMIVGYSASGAVIDGGVNKWFMVLATGRSQSRVLRLLSTGIARVRSSANFFRCPTCGENLRPQPRMAHGEEFVCASGHYIPVASDGHVHLIPTGRLRRRKGTEPGDARGAMRARQRFFDQGGFSAQINSVAEAVVGALPSQGTAQVLDVGCGEGRYLRALEAQLDENGLAAYLWGVDVCKFGVAQAARRQPTATFAVAKCTRLPFKDGVFDCVLSVFAPVPWDEFRRVLRPGGTAVVVRGGPSHLLGLKGMLYEQTREQPHPQWPEVSEARESSARVVTVESYPGELAASLFMMSPFWWTASPQQQQDICTRAAVTTEVDFIISTYRF